MLAGVLRARQKQRQVIQESSQQFAAAAVAFLQDPSNLTEVRNLYREKLDLYHRSLKVHRERMMKDEELKRAVLRKDPSERTHEENLFVVC